MRTKLMLFPYQCRCIGWWILIPTLILGMIILICDNSISYFDNFLNQYGMVFKDISITGIITGSIMIACSKVEYEDELIAHIRLNSLLLALYINSALVIIATLIFNSIYYLYVMACNLCTLPLTFVIIFEIFLRKLNQSIRDEK